MALDPERVRSVFLAAAQNPKPAERTVLLDTACAGDSELRSRVEVLLNDFDRNVVTTSAPVAGNGSDGVSAENSGNSDPGLTVVYGQGGVASKPNSRDLPNVKGYEVYGELGRGGMGVVYRARQVQLNRPCVLKMILAGVHADDEATRRFLAEAEAVARLQHPNIVQIHHIGEADGLPYFELEYLEGGSLDRQLDGTPWPAPRAAVLVEALARGIAEAHRLGIIHRDLKPGNVLLAADGTPKVTDFGLAKALGSDVALTRTNSIIGSPCYISPEQATGKSKRVGTSADVYSLGAILYELLTGRPPFVGTNIIEILCQVEATEPVSPARMVPGLSRDMETIVVKCLQKEPSRRYESAAALTADLRRFVSGEPILARPVPFWERLWRSCRRHPVPATLTASLVLVAMLGLAGILWQWDEAVKARDLASSRAVTEAAARLEADNRRIEAEASLAMARKAVDDSFTKVSENKLLIVPGMRQLRRELLESALGFYEEFVRRDNKEPDLMVELAATQARIGLIYSDLSELNKARTALELAAQLYETTLTARRDDLELLERLSEVEHQLGSLGWRGSYEWAVAAYQRAIAIRERLAAERPGEPRFRMALSRSWNGICLVTTGDAQREAVIRALALRLKLAGEIADDPDLLHGLNESLQNVHVFLLGSGHSEEALELARRSIEYGRASLARRPYDTEYAIDFSLAYGKAGDTCWKLGYRDEALAILSEWVTFLRKLCAGNPEVSMYRNELATTLAIHARWLAELDRGPEAVAWLRQAAELLAANPDPNGGNLATAATYRANAARLLAGPLSTQPLASWPEAARIETDLAVSDLKRAVDLGYRESDVIRQSKHFQPLLDRSDVKALVEEMDHPTAPFAAIAGAPEIALGRLPSPLDQPGRLEEDRILGDLAIARVEEEQGQQGDSARYTSRLEAIVERMQALRSSGPTSPALERFAESIRIEIATEFLKAGKRAELQEMFSRLPEEASEQPHTLLQRGELFEMGGLTARADIYWTRALAAAPDDTVIHRLIAAAQSRRGRWDLAAETLVGLAERNPNDHRSWYLAAVVAARAGDAERWQRLCRPMLDRFRETDNAELAERTAKCCLLIRGRGPEQQQAGQLAEHAVKLATGGVTPWALNAKALASYRSDDFAGALALAEASLAAFGPGAPRDFQVPPQCVRAMSLIRLGQLDAAKAALEQVSALGFPAGWQTTARDPGGGWVDPLIGEILYREAEALINAAPVVPADPLTP